MSFGPSGPYLKLKFVVIFQPIRELEFWGRLSDLFLSPKSAIQCQICKQLSLLCETMTYFIFAYAIHFDSNTNSYFNDF